MATLEVEIEGVGILPNHVEDEVSPRPSSPAQEASSKTKGMVMTRVLFRNAMVWDATGAESFPADVLVDGGRIKTIARTLNQLSSDGATIVDCHGMTLMPGLVEGHAHISFGGAVRFRSRPDPAGGAPAAHHAQRQDPARPRLHQRL